MVAAVGHYGIFDTPEAMQCLSCSKIADRGADMCAHTSTKEETERLVHAVCLPCFAKLLRVEKDGSSYLCPGCKVTVTIDPSTPLGVSAARIYDFMQTKLIDIDGTRQFIAALRQDKLLPLAILFSDRPICPKRLAEALEIAIKNNLPLAAAILSSDRLKEFSIEGNPLEVAIKSDHSMAARIFSSPTCLIGPSELGRALRAAIEHKHVLAQVILDSGRSINPQKLAQALQIAIEQKDTLIEQKDTLAEKILSSKRLKEFSIEGNPLEVAIKSGHSLARWIFSSPTCLIGPSELGRALRAAIEHKHFLAKVILDSARPIDPNLLAQALEIAIKNHDSFAAAILSSGRSKELGLVGNPLEAAIKSGHSLARGIFSSTTCSINPFELGQAFIAAIEYKHPLAEEILDSARPIDPKQLARALEIAIRNNHTLADRIREASARFKETPVSLNWSAFQLKSMSKRSKQLLKSFDMRDRS